MPEWKKNQIVEVEYAGHIFKYKLKEQLTQSSWDGYLLDENNQVRFHPDKNNEPIIHVVTTFDKNV